MMMQPLPDIIAYPLAEALLRLKTAGYSVRSIKEAVAPGKPGGGHALRVARVKADGNNVDLVVVADRSKPVKQGAP